MSELVNSAANIWEQFQYEKWLKNWNKSKKKQKEKQRKKWQQLKKVQ